MQVIPYYQHLAQNLLHFMEQREEGHGKIAAEYKLTLKLLQDIQAGVVDVKSVVITDDGWQLMPPGDEDDDS